MLCTVTSTTMHLFVIVIFALALQCYRYSRSCKTILQHLGSKYRAIFTLTCRLLISFRQIVTLSHFPCFCLHAGFGVQFDLTLTVLSDLHCVDNGDKTGVCSVFRSRASRFPPDTLFTFSAHSDHVFPKKPIQVSFFLSPLTYSRRK